MTPAKDYNLTVGLRIREIREALHLTREQFSEMCDISSSFLAAIENGRKSITSKTIYKICTSVNISVDYLILGKEQGFEGDMVVEMLRALPESSRSHAIRILREFTEAVQAPERAEKSE